MEWLGTMAEDAGDIEEAIGWYFKACDLDSGYAMFRIAGLYESGMLSGEPNTEKAVEWYQKAADHGYQFAADKLDELQNP